MKTKYIIALFIVGIMVMMIGSMFKILHWPHAGRIIIAATALQIVSAVLAICKVLTGKNNFLNS